MNRKSVSKTLRRTGIGDVRESEDRERDRERQREWEEREREEREGREG